MKWIFQIYHFVGLIISASLVEDYIVSEQRTREKYHLHRITMAHAKKKFLVVCEAI